MPIPQDRLQQLTGDLREESRKVFPGAGVAAPWGSVFTLSQDYSVRAELQESGSLRMQYVNDDGTKIISKDGTVRYGEMFITVQNGELELTGDFAFNKSVAINDALKVLGIMDHPDASTLAEQIFRQSIRSFGPEFNR